MTTSRSRISTEREEHIVFARLGEAGSKSLGTRSGQETGSSPAPGALHAGAPAGRSCLTHGPWEGDIMKVRVHLSPYRRYVVMLGLLLAGFWVAIPAWSQEGSQTESQKVEINEYQGEKLGSVSDFRENSIKGVQKVDPATYTLRVDGLVQSPSSFSYDELLAMKHVKKLVTINCVEGWSVTALWEGIPLPALFDLVKPTPEANTVIFTAADGYTTSLPLSTIEERNLIIADHINGLVLPPANGFPYQLVAENKWGYKWIRWIVRIDLSSDSDYKGYWESRGFNNNGSIDGPMF
jgi:DMSO/TMAO reductase YedYZ molybdopterin-dependent catalytic subunit